MPQPPLTRKQVRRVAFSDRAGGNLAVMKACYERGIELPAEPEPKPGERGAGVPLVWDDEIKDPQQDADPESVGG